MLTIRPESAADAGQVYALLARCFPSDAEVRLVDALRDASRLTVSLVAAKDGAIIGHVAVSPVTTAAGPRGVGLAPVAVDEPHRRRGVGAALVRAAIEACRDAGEGWIVVLGEPGYYQRFGFRPASRFGLTDAYFGGDAFQALELVPGALPRDAGLVRYAPEFDALA